MKKNLFLAFVVILLLLVMKEKTYKETLERIDVNYSEVIKFNGKLFLPKTLQFGEDVVNKNRAGIIILDVSGKKYRYYRKYEYNTYFLNIEPEDVPVNVGTRIETDFREANLNGSYPVKLYFARRIE